MICTILYVITAGVLTGLVNYKSLNVPDPLAIGIDATNNHFGSFLVKLGALMGLTSTIVVMLLGQSRVFFSMSRDRLLPGFFSVIHPRFRTPGFPRSACGFFVALLAASLPINQLGDMVNIGTLLAFAIVSAGVWVLRRRNPDLPRPFKTPWVPVVPILGILFSLWWMYNLPGITWLRLIDMADHRHVYLFRLRT